jgi:hypothetical protein
MMRELWYHITRGCVELRFRGGYRSKSGGKKAGVELGYEENSSSLEKPSAGYL